MHLKRARLEESFSPQLYSFNGIVTRLFACFSEMCYNTIGMGKRGTEQSC